MLVNTALSDARDHGAMARAFAMATEAGRLAYRDRLGSRPRHRRGFLTPDGFPGGVAPWNTEARSEVFLPNWTLGRGSGSRTSSIVPHLTMWIAPSLARERTVEDLAALLSPCVAERLETVAGEAQRLTRWHFGRTIGLYAPIYISNICEANCLYCGYATGSGNKEKRVDAYAGADSPRMRGIGRIWLPERPATYGWRRQPWLRWSTSGRAWPLPARHFPAVSIEMYAMTYEQYAYLCRRGLEGVTPLHRDVRPPYLCPVCTRAASRRTFCTGLTPSSVQAGRARVD